MKKKLAFEIVKLLWGEKAAIDSQDSFEQTFQEKRPTFDIKVSAGESIITTIIPFTSLSSASEAKRLLKQNAVSVNGNKITDSSYIVKSGDEIKVGSRTFLIAQASNKAK